ncbi:13028_t:CDS:2, partial [Entrophospora sp. SA101]
DLARLWEMPASVMMQECGLYLVDKFNEFAIPTRTSQLCKPG